MLKLLTKTSAATRDCKYDLFHCWHTGVQYRSYKVNDIASRAPVGGDILAFVNREGWQLHNKRDT